MQSLARASENSGGGFRPPAATFTGAFGSRRCTVTWLDAEKFEDIAYEFSRRFSKLFEKPVENLMGG
jgi:hypothetical protein